ncbi:MAG: tetratricopeptide repeat protein [Hyphomicrobiaceae bacterium]
MRRYAAAALVAGVVAAAPLSAGAQGTTSSWTSRTIPQKPEAGAPAKPPAARVRRRSENVPAAPAGPPPARGQARLGPPPGLAAPLGKATAPVTGENAAFEAFELGQYLTAKRLAETAATKGDAAAHTLIARLYAEGLGVARDEALAARWYAKGADLGDTEAAFALGVMMAEGRSIKQDRATAAELFERAALKGHPYAHYNLALLFLRGDGKPENPYRAFLHLRYAAEQGIAAAQYDLATLFLTGHGVKADAYQASLWLRRAADQGLASAEFEYAVLLLRGGGLNADLPRAIGYLRSAAGKGIAAAQNRLAHAYLSGMPGLPQDHVQAQTWRILARDAGLADEALDKQLARRPKTERQRAEIAAQAIRDQSAIGTASAGVARP